MAIHVIVIGLSYVLLSHNRTQQKDASGIDQSTKPSEGAPRSIVDYSTRHHYSMRICTHWCVPDDNHVFMRTKIKISNSICGRMRIADVLVDSQRSPSGSPACPRAHRHPRDCRSSYPTGHGTAGGGPWAISPDRAQVHCLAIGRREPEHSKAPTHKNNKIYNFNHEFRAPERAHCCVEELPDRAHYFVDVGYRLSTSQVKAGRDVECRRSFPSRGYVIYRGVQAIEAIGDRGEPPTSLPNE